VDKVYLVLQAPNIFEQCLWWCRKTATIPFERTEATKEITEGAEATITYKDTGYANIGLQQIRRIEVRDKVGRVWKSARRFGQAHLRAALAAELVEEKRCGDEGGRHAHFRLYKVAEDWCLFWRVSAGKSATYSSRSYRKRGEADRALSTFVERADKFVAGELECDQVQQF